MAANAHAATAGSRGAILISRTAQGKSGRSIGRIHYCVKDLYWRLAELRSESPDQTSP